MFCRFKSAIKFYTRVTQTDFESKLLNKIFEIYFYLAYLHRPILITKWLSQPYNALLRGAPSNNPHLTTPDYCPSNFANYANSSSAFIHYPFSYSHFYLQLLFDLYQNIRVFFDDRIFAINLLR